MSSSEKRARDFKAVAAVYREIGGDSGNVCRFNLNVIWPVDGEPR
jgi:hypothetical protein